MRILQITSVAPGHLSGGAMGVRQTLLSLKGLGAEVDYMGPEIEDGDLRALYTKDYALAPNRNRAQRVLDTLFMKSNLRYRSFLAADFDPDAYDAVLLDFTRQHYVLERVPAEKLIVRVHNVEKDYAESVWEKEKSLPAFFDRLYSGKRERLLVRKAARLLALTKEDAGRLAELYGKDLAEKTDIIPVCLPDTAPPEDPGAQNGGVFTMLLNGSLWFGPNYDGVKFFLSEVWPKLGFGRRLIIAGARPNDELKGLIRGDERIELADTPPDMLPYMRRADISLAPVFSGAGMKVKVADALSQYLPVAGTPHAFTGYRVADGENSFVCETAEDFIRALTRFEALSPEERGKMRLAARRLYLSDYSQEASTELFGKSILALREGKR